MPQTIYGSQVGSETLRAGDTLTISVDAGSGAVVSGRRYPSKTLRGPWAFPQTVGGV